MDKEPPSSLFGGHMDSNLVDGQIRFMKALAKNPLAYWANVYITKSGSTPMTKTLEDYLSSDDFSSIEARFVRTVEHIQSDSHTSITATCAIIEATLKLNLREIGAQMEAHLFLELDKTQKYTSYERDPFLSDAVWKAACYQK